MSCTLTEKILREHLADGSYEPGKEIGIKIDQTLTQDATGTMAYLQFESMGLSDIATELSVSYVDHNTIQVGFENADDHAYLESIAKKYGIYFSQTRKWHLPPGPSGKVRETRQDPAWFRQPYTHRRRRRLAGHRCWRPRCGSRNGRWRILPDRASSNQCPPHRQTSTLGLSQRCGPQSPPIHDHQR